MRQQEEENKMRRGERKGGAPDKRENLGEERRDEEEGEEGKRDDDWCPCMRRDSIRGGQLASVEQSSHGTPREGELLIAWIKAPFIHDSR